MDLQTPEDSIPSAPVTEQQIRQLAGRPPVTGAWRVGDPRGAREFVTVPLTLESGSAIAAARIAFETWGTLAPAGDNAVLIVHALTGDAHVRGDAGPGQPTAGWWDAVVGPGKAIDTDRWFVVCSNVLGGCQGSTGPSSVAEDGREWAERFPVVSIRDQVAAQAALADRLGIARWHAVIGGSVGGMQALEWAVGYPDRLGRCAVIAAPAVTTADQIALNSVQEQAVLADPEFRGGAYYDALVGPHRGLALARRIALLSYRSAKELDLRFGRSAQSTVSPLSERGRFAVESYLDFHGNKFTRRFDANSYLLLLSAMNSHDIGRGRGGLDAALAAVTARTLVVGIDSDRLFPLESQRLISAGIANSVSGPEPVVVSSIYGHDAFLIESDVIGGQLRALLDEPETTRPSV